MNGYGRQAESLLRSAQAKDVESLDAVAVVDALAGIGYARLSVAAELEKRS